MAKHRWSILCHRACIDKYSNMMSILDITEQITIEEVPEALPENVAFPVNLQLVSLWHREHAEEPESLWSTFELLLPNGEIFHHNGKKLEIDLESSPRTRLIFGIQAIPFKGAGEYWFHVYRSHDEGGPWELMERVPLEVVIKKGATVSSTPPEQQRVEQTPPAPLRSASQREPSLPRHPISPTRRRRSSS